MCTNQSVPSLNEIRCALWDRFFLDSSLLPTFTLTKHGCKILASLHAIGGTHQEAQQMSDGTAMRIMLAVIFSKFQRLPVQLRRLEFASIT